MADREDEIKSGYKSSEFALNLGPYAMVITLLYTTLMDPDVAALVSQACQGLPDNVQALVQIGLKAIGLIGSIIVSNKAADVSRGYSKGRTMMKQQLVSRSEAALKWEKAIELARAKQCK